MKKAEEIYKLNNYGMVPVTRLHEKLATSLRISYVKYLDYFEMVTIRVAVTFSKTRVAFLQQNLTRLILQQTFFQWRSKGRSSSLKISSYSLCFTEAFMCEN